MVSTYGALLNTISLGSTISIPGKAAQLFSSRQVTDVTSLPKDFYYTEKSTGLFPDISNSSAIINSTSRNDI